MQWKSFEIPESMLPLYFAYIEDSESQGADQIGDLEILETAPPEEAVELSAVTLAEARLTATEMWVREPRPHALGYVVTDNCGFRWIKKYMRGPWAKSSDVVVRNAA